MKTQYYKSNIMKYLFLFFSVLLYSQQNKYESKMINSSASFQFKSASYYDYQINAKKTDSLYKEVQTGLLPENLLSQKYANFFIKQDPKEKKELVLYSRITLEYNLIRLYFIKFSLRENNKKNNQIFVYQENKNGWVEANNSDIVQKIKTILSLTNSAFSEFEIKENNSKYPEINKLKPLIRDADGTINLFKLAEIIEKNKKELAKYLEE